MVLGLSIWIVVDAPSFVDIADSVGVNIVIYDTGCYVLIAISSLVIIITFLGCCGAAKHSRCLLVTVREMSKNQNIFYLLTNIYKSKTIQKVNVQTFLIVFSISSVF